jgi:hypothetical protein
LAPWGVIVPERIACVAEPSLAEAAKPVRSISPVKVEALSSGSESKPTVPNVAALLKRSTNRPCGLAWEAPLFSLPSSPKPM